MVLGGMVLGGTKGPPWAADLVLCKPGIVRRGMVVGAWVHCLSVCPPSARLLVWETGCFTGATELPNWFRARAKLGYWC